MKIGDKVKCIQYISYEIKMNEIYTVIGIQIGFDNKKFIHLKEVNSKMSYCMENFKNV